MEFHVSKKSRDGFSFESHLFSLRGTVVFANLPAAREFARKLQTKYPQIRYQDIFAMGLIDEILHYVINQYSQSLGGGKEGVFSSRMYRVCLDKLGEKKVQSCIVKFATLFPPVAVYRGEIPLMDYLNTIHDGVSGWAQELEEMLMLWVENQNPAYQICDELFNDQSLAKNTCYQEIINCMYQACMDLPAFGPDLENIIDMIRAPALNHPHSLELQLDYIRTRWSKLLGDFLSRLLRGIDYLKEVNAFFLKQGMAPGPGVDLYVPDYHRVGMEEYERFTPDRDWMPRVVLLAKSTLVWLHQLSVKYDTAIQRLDQIPDEELDLISSRGFNALWLIGLWDRSDASRKIKNRCGNPEAAASAYALMGYDISDEIGGWKALENLRWRAWNRGIRMASDMVPNHTGIESHWVYEHPEYFIQLDHPPFPSYKFNSETLSSRSEVGIFLEDHYYDRTDAAVVFKRVDYRTGSTRYIYHGNDGTHMPWNDTAQLDFSKKEVREAIIDTIVHVARNFPIIRFDAAMTLAKKHIQRLWFPEPGRGGDIPSRAEHGMTSQDFDRAIPQEFWREVVDRCAVEAPDTLLLAEAFWMMEGYFVRTLGMHRVYNSAFMNMLKMEENFKYRQTIKNTVNFDRDILKRFVNFMNNPDEETAVAQFGNGDKYFGVCTLMVTMPGLPMFGHGQVEGFTEKYGMEFRKAYREEQPDRNLIERHYREIFPLMKKRYLFADVDQFCLFDFYTQDGGVNEQVYAYTNAHGQEHALVLYNNAYASAFGKIHTSCEYLVKQASGEKTMQRSSLAQALGLQDTADGFCIMQEQRGGKWYIRRNKDIHDNGLTIILQGYQSQVYLNIYQVQDNAYQHYGQLHDKLAGAGFLDINDAIREIVLGPVHRAFMSTCAEGLAQSAKAEGAMELLVDKFKEFVELTKDMVPSKESWLERPLMFSKLIDSLTKLLDSIREPETLIEKNKESWRTYLAEQLETEKGLYGVLSVLLLYVMQEENREWNLETQLESIGEIRHYAKDLCDLISGLSGWHSDKPDEGDIIEALGFFEVQNFLKINYYNQVRWYNKERMDVMPWWICLFESLRIAASDNPQESKFKRIYQISMTLEKAHEMSDCRLDEFKKKIKASKPKTKIPKQ